MSWDVYDVGSNNRIRQLSKTYQEDGKKKVAISNNVCKLNMVSTLTQQQLDTCALQRVRIGKNVTSLATNCFNGCKHLSSVLNCDSITDIGNYAFMNCEDLKSITLFDKNNKQKVENIGLCAFANTGLESVYLSFRGTGTETQIYDSAFANCKKLKDVTWKTSDYTSDYLFENCTSLTGVNFCGKHSFIGEHVFKGCTALRKVQIPAACYMLNKFEFEDCSNLTSVTCGEPSQMTRDRAIDDCVFKGTAMKSFTFPTSITSFSQISEYALMGAENLTSITFAGMNSDELWQEYHSDTISNKDFVFNKWMYDVNPAYEYSQQIDGDKFKQVITYAQVNHIPLVATYHMDKADCSACRHVASRMNREETITWMKSLTKKILFVQTHTDGKSTLKSSYKKLWSQIAKETHDESYSTSTSMPKKLLYWKKEDGTVLQWCGTHGCSYTKNDFPTVTSGEFDEQMKYFVEVSCADYCSYTTTDTKFSASNEGLSKIDGNYTPNIWLYDKSLDYEYSEKCDDTLFSLILTRMKALNVPIVLVEGNVGCGPCSQFKNYINNEEHGFKAWMQSLTKPFVFLNVVAGVTDKKGRVIVESSVLANQAFSLMKEIRGYKDGYTYPTLMLYWKKPDGSVVCDWKEPRGIAFKPSEHAQRIKDFVEKDCASYLEPTQVTGDMTIIDYGIEGTHCFGLNHNCIIHSADGKQIEYEDDGLGMDYADGGYVGYESSVQVDRITKDDFRYGQWYYQAKDLREFADANEIPVFLEFSTSRSCGPCKDFHETIFNNTEFQQYMKNKRILLCNVDSKSNFKYDVEHYISHQWAVSSDPGYEANRLPVMMLYWFRKNGLVSPYDEQNTYYDLAEKEYMYYDDHENPELSDNWDVQKLSAKIDEFCKGYVPQDKFNLPDIEDHTDNIPNKFLCCQNQVDDTYGRYFPVYEQLPSQGHVYKVKIGDTEYEIDESMIGEEGATLPPNGTYQYFTTLSTDTNYELTCDMEGILFQIGPRPKHGSALDVEYSPSIGKSVDAFLSEYGITTEMIVSQDGKGKDEIYQVDEDTGRYLYEEKVIGEETLKVPIINEDNDCKTPSNNYQYNYIITYTLKNCTYQSKEISTVKLFIEKVSYTEDEGETLKYKDGGNVVQGNLLGNQIYDNVNGLRWLKAFSNDIGEAT